MPLNKDCLFPESLLLKILICYFWSILLIASGICRCIITITLVKILNSFWIPCPLITLLLKNLINLFPSHNPRRWIAKRGLSFFAPSCCELLRRIININLYSKLSQIWKIVIALIHIWVINIGIVILWKYYSFCYSLWFFSLMHIILKYLLIIHSCVVPDLTFLLI